MTEPFRVECPQDTLEPTMIFTHEGRRIFVSSRNLRDGTTLKRIEEETRQASALYRKQREECGCATCLEELQP